jgi:hypothetical protein
MRSFLKADDLRALVAGEFGTDRRLSTLDRLAGGSKKGVYRLTLDDATTAILYLWADAESYWPPSPTVPDDPFADASGAELAVVVVEPRVVGGQLLALRDIPRSYSASSKATRCRSSAIWMSEFCRRLRGGVARHEVGCG